MIKKFLSDLAKDTLQHGKDALKESISKAANDALQQGKDALKESIHKGVNDVVSDFSRGFHAEKSAPAEKDWELVDNTEPEYSPSRQEVAAPDIQSSLVKTGLSVMTAKTPLGALNVLNNFCEMVGEVRRFTEIQQTRRAEISAERDIVVNRIQAQKEVLLVYLEKSFDERKENFEKFFAVVDDAIAKGNLQQLALGLESINKLAAESPFKALASISATQKALENPDHVWDF